MKGLFYLIIKNFKFLLLHYIRDIVLPVFVPFPAGSKSKEKHENEKKFVVRQQRSCDIQHFLTSNTKSGWFNAFILWISSYIFTESFYLRRRSIEICSSHVFVIILAHARFVGLRGFVSSWRLNKKVHCSGSLLILMLSSTLELVLSCFEKKIGEI